MPNDDYNDCDYCYECQGYGDDYGYDEDGNYVCLCDKCFMNPFRNDDDN